MCHGKQQVWTRARGHVLCLLLVAQRRGILVGGKSPSDPRSHPITSEVATEAQKAFAWGQRLGCQAAGEGGRAPCSPLPSLEVLWWDPSSLLVRGLLLGMPPVFQTHRVRPFCSHQIPTDSTQSNSCKALGTAC